ncbi:MAG: calcium-binding protein, partial [Candidatus Binatia bacterium]
MPEPNEAYYAEILDGVTQKAEIELIKKVVELAFHQTLSVVGETLGETIAHGAKLDAIRFIAERNTYWTVAEEAFKQASQLPNSKKKEALLAQAFQFREQARQVETRFLQQFAPAMNEFADGVRHVFGGVGDVVGRLLGPAIGGIFLQRKLSQRLDQALEEGRPPEYAAQLVTVEATALAVAGLAELTGVIKTFIDTGVLHLANGTSITVSGAGARALWVIGRATGAAALVTGVFYVFYNGTTWLYQQPFVAATLLDGVEGLVNFVSPGSTEALFESDLGALALLVTRVDGTLRAAALNDIVRASAPTYRDRAELIAVHDRLRRLLAPDLPTVPITNGDEYFNTVVKTLSTIKARYAEGTLTIVPLTGQDAGTLAVLAKVDSNAVAYRYALKELNSFAVLGVDYVGLHNGNEVLSLYSPTTGKGALSDAWLIDRGTMLALMLERNTRDFAADRVSRTGGAYSYDYTQVKGNPDGSDYRFTVLSQNPSSQLNRIQITFGSEQADTITGGNVFKGDHLYGGGGDDTISGEDGQDYLEGNAGADTLRGGVGEDTLLGGEGVDTLYGDDNNDMLIGGADDDRLEGGDGLDTYVVQGRDTIVDTDGEGVIRDASGKEVAGLFVKRDGQYVFVADPSITATKNSPLTITLADGSVVVVEDFEDGEFGINLVDLPAAPTTPPIVGDLAPIDGDLSMPGIQYTYDALGNVVVNPDIPDPDRADGFYDSAGADRIQAKGGDDAINAWRGGDDRIEAGPGADIASGGPGEDIVYAGSEIAIESAYTVGDAQAPTGKKGDWLDGAGGDDVLIGDAGDDALTGGAGGDVLFGGGGADNIFGDHTTTLVYLDWTITRETERLPDNVTLYRTIYSQAWVTDEAVGGADTLYGGAGVDWLFSGNGDDYLDGGRDDDVLFGQLGHDVLVGGTGADVLSGDSWDDPEDPTDPPGSLHGSDYLAGGTGNDLLHGNGGDDWLFGDAGDDELGGDDTKTPGEYHGVDYLDGGAGADRLWGYGKDDVLIGGTGDDHLEGDYSRLDGQYHGADLLEGGAGNDELIGQGGSDELWGGDGDDLMSGDGPSTEAQYEGADRLFGEEGDDDLEGNGGDDLLDGGPGTDNLRGGEGADTLIGGEGADQLDGGPGDDILITDGADVIVDTEGDNTVVFGAFGASEFTLGLALGDGGEQYLALTDAAGTTIAIENGFLNAAQTFEFADGAQADLRTLMATVQVTQGFAIHGTAQADTAYGTRLDDTLDGKAGDDTLEAGGGADTLIGGEGNDEYRFGRGDGADTIDNTDPEPNAVDTLRLAAGVVAIDVILRRNGNDLLVQLRDTPDQVTVLNHFTAAPLDRILFHDATEWDQAAIASRLTSALTNGPDNFTGTAGNDFIQALDGNDTVFGVGGDDLIEGGAGFDNLRGGQGNDVLLGQDGPDNLYGEPGDDILNGGAGTDYLEGGTGNDTFEFAPGGAQDTIQAFDTGIGTVDRLKLGTGILPSEVLLRRNGSDHLFLTVNGSTDQITVWQHFTNDSYALDRIEFADGTVWDAAVMRSKVLAATPGADYLIGYAGDDTIDGLGGNDNILGRDGHDVLSGGRGGDSLYGEAGDDTLIGGADNDTLAGGAGNDRYVFARGDGFDQIRDYDPTPAKLDTLAFAAGIAPAEVVLQRLAGYLQDDLVVLVPDPAGGSALNQITVKDAFVYFDNRAKIDQIVFADATTWSLADIKARLLATTDKDDVVVGYETDDVIDAKGGRDSVDGDQGDDRLLGGDGVDNL